MLGMDTADVPTATANSCLGAVAAGHAKFLDQLQESHPDAASGVLDVLGRCSSRVKRVVRLTRVPIALLLSPMMRSPSQCPGTARSATSAGR